MVRLKKEVKQQSVVDWPFDLQIDLPSSTKNRLAFMSTQSRTFFPEDPGFSRFGIAYSMNCAPGDIPNPKYFPSEDRLAKPVSTKGYGMGGLSGPRFVKLHLANNPAPNAYQRQIVELPHLHKRRSSYTQVKKKKKVSDDEAIGGEKRSLLPQPPHHITRAKKERLRQLCLQHYIGFGTHLTVNRFGIEPSFHNVGVGYYDLRKQAKKLAVTGSFGRKPVKLIPPTVTRCNYMGHDKCFECEEVLSTVDYYRTWKKVPNPFRDPANKNKPGTNDSEDRYYTMPAEEGVAKIYNMKNIFVSLCRKCHCQALRGESKLWDPTDVPLLFHKTRHCTYIHDHKNIPIFTHKTSCNYVHRVGRKEAVMAKHYPDDCERVFKEK